jgi:hypothetical protein
MRKVIEIWSGFIAGNGRQVGLDYDNSRFSHGLLATKVIIWLLR